MLALLIARMESQMMVDGVAPDLPAPGWFIECAEDSAPIFLRHGFARVPVDYRPPSIIPARHGPAEPLHLLYKPFGTAFAPLDLNRDFVLRALREILTHIYAVKRPVRHARYRRAVNSLAVDAQGRVRLA